MLRSISGRLITLLTLCASLAFGVGMAIDYVISRDAILARLEVEARETVNRAITDLDNLLDGVEGSTLLLGHILSQREYSHSGLEQLAKNLVSNNDDIFGSTIALNPELTDQPGGFAPYFFDNNGVLQHKDLREGPANYWERDWFSAPASAGKATWSEPYFDSEGAKVLMTTFSVPVYRSSEDGRRQLYGVVTADITLAELHSYLGRLRLGASGFGILLSQNGMILSSRDDSDIMRHYSEAIEDSAAIATWQNMLQGVRAGQVVDREMHCDEFPGACRVRLSMLQSTNWPVGVAYSREEILSPLREYRLTSALITLVTLTLTAISVFLVTRRITRPLKDLAGATRELAQGNFNTPLPVTRSNDEIAQLVQSFKAMQSELQSHIADLEAMTASRSRLEGELAAAREIQMSMLPGGGQAFESGENYRLWARVRPAKSVGGDLYTVYRCGSQLFLAVGDVSDKGVPAALFMAKAISLVQQLASTGTAPDAAMSIINDALERGNDNCMFVTLFLGMFDQESLQLQFASAGHCAPLLQRGDEVQALPQSDGPALGLAPGLSFACNTQQLQAGDRLVVFTDGIDEAFNDKGEMFGLDRFVEQIRLSARQPTDAAGGQLFRAVQEHAGAQPQSDDITLLLLDVGPATAGSVRCSFQRGPLLITRVLAWLEQQAPELGINNSVTMELALVAEEAVINVDQYAGLGPDDSIDLQLQTSAGNVVLIVRDGGAPFDPLTQARRAPLGSTIESADIGGLGVHLIAQLTDQQQYRREGDENVLTLIKSLA